MKNKNCNFKYYFYFNSIPTDLLFAYNCSLISHSTDFFLTFRIVNTKSEF